MVSIWKVESIVPNGVFIEHGQSYALRDIFMKEKELIALKGTKKFIIYYRYRIIEQKSLGQSSNIFI